MPDIKSAKALLESLDRAVTFALGHIADISLRCGILVAIGPAEIEQAAPSDSYLGSHAGRNSLRLGHPRQGAKWHFFSDSAKAWYSEHFSLRLFCCLPWPAQHCPSRSAS
jgi:hypothetical protein